MREGAKLTEPGRQRKNFLSDVWMGYAAANVTAIPGDLAHTPCKPLFAMRFENNRRDVSNKDH